MELRVMSSEDAPAAADVFQEAVADADRRAGRPVDVPEPERVQRLVRGLQRFPETDPEGCWIAADGEMMRGFSAAVRRGPLWGLALLFVRPEFQSAGVGRALLERALQTSEDAEVAMIMSSSDPRAIRRYGCAGFAIHPGVEVAGPVDRSALPGDLPVRPGTPDDLELVDRVDLELRGSSRRVDAAFLLDQGAAMVVHEHGYAFHRRGSPIMLGAETVAAAQALLWACLGEATEDVGAWAWTAEQGWAVEVALAARLRVTPGGPMFVRGRDRLPGPWLPNGWYF
jgi:GNAT superfamily N-acetyltransferase